MILSTSKFKIIALGLKVPLLSLGLEQPGTGCIHFDTALHSSGTNFQTIFDKSRRYNNLKTRFELGIRAEIRASAVHAGSSTTFISIF